MEKEEPQYSIDFVDPNELIEFIEEGQDIDLSETAGFDQESTTDVNEESELLYTDKIAEEAGEYIIKKQEDTRGRLAILYTVFTFLIFIIGIVICVLDGILRNVSIIDNLSTVLPLLSGLFLGTLGFVIGYYFRREE